MKKLLVATFAGVLAAVFAFTAQAAEERANLGWIGTYTRPKTNCTGHCTTSCRNFRTKKCKTIVTWKKSCAVHYGTWTKKCTNHPHLSTVCTRHKHCHQACVRYVNDRGAYIKCYGKMKCSFTTGCRTFWTNHQTCRLVRSSHVHCTNRPVFTRRCTVALKPGYCVRRCSSVCVIRR